MSLTKGTVRRTSVALGDLFLTLADGSSRRIQPVGLVDANGNHISFGSDTATGGTAEDSNVIKASAGILGEIFVQLKAGTSSARTIMLFDAASLPSNGAAPKWRIPVEAAKGSGWNFPQGLVFATGIVAALSSTETTLTVTTGTEGWFQATFA